MNRADLRALIGLRRQLQDRPCPVCGAADAAILLPYDRYFLPIRVGACRSCGAVYATRALDAAGAARYYGQLYGALMSSRQPASIDAQRAAIADFRAARIAAQCGPRRRVLEIGCGAGWFLAAMTGQGAVQLGGIEPGVAAAAEARRRLGAAAVIADGALETSAPPLPQADLIAAFHVLEHLADPGAALERLAGWLAPEGWLVLEVPDMLGPWERFGLFQFHVGHASYFTMASLTALLARHGFAVAHVEKEGADSLIHPGNLRVFARRGTGAVPAETVDVAAYIRARIKPWSLRHGYPRAAIRLLRLWAGI